MVVMTVGLFITSCKKKFDAPPPIGDPGIVANTTIKDLKTRYNSGKPVLIGDTVISGIVSCDDRSGNFYQQIAIQDATGGILLRLGSYNLFNNFPVGRQVFVKCKGLWLGQYNGTMQLGGGVDSGYILQGGVTLLAANLIDLHVIKGALNQPLVPQVVTIAQLTTNIQDKYISTLIKLQGFEFADRTNKYADDGQSGNRIIQDCSLPQNKITVRTSNYCNFATLPLPQGNGEIIGVYSYFGSTKQFTIRDTTDVRFYGPRCPTVTGDGAITLGTTSPFTINFDAIGTSGLPPGVFAKKDATSAILGNEGAVYNNSFVTPTAWSQTSLGFKNFASATGLTSVATSTVQNASTNRALGFRQTGTASDGGDPGAAFVFQLNNTSGKTNLKLDFLLQSLDASAAGRTATWKVDYGFGDSPSTFTAIATVPSPLTTVLSTTGFKSTPVAVNFGTVLDNISQKIWIRIVTFTATTGSGSRPSTAIDDVKFSWN